MGEGLVELQHQLHSVANDERNAEALDSSRVRQQQQLSTSQLTVVVVIVVIVVVVQELESLMGAQQALSSKLLQDLQQLKAVAQTSDSDPMDNNAVTYELFMNNNQSTTQPQLQHIEARIFAVEQQIGSNITSIDPSNGLIGTIEDLQLQVDAITPIQMEAVASTAAQVAIQLERATRADQLRRDVQSDDVKQVHAVAELMKRWDASLVDTLPAVVTRLKSLQRLHGETAMFAQRLDAIEQQQTTTTTTTATTTPK